MPSLDKPRPEKNPPRTSPAQSWLNPERAPPRTSPAQTPPLLPCSLTLLWSQGLREKVLGCRTDGRCTHRPTDGLLDSRLAIRRPVHSGQSRPRSPLPETWVSAAGHIYKRQGHTKPDLTNPYIVITRTRARKPHGKATYDPHATQAPAEGRALVRGFPSGHTGPTPHAAGLGGRSPDTG